MPPSLTAMSPDHPDHETVLIDGPHGAPVPIDRGIADLITHVWRASIATVQSCERWRAGMPWIQFAEASDAAAFLAIVGDPADTVVFPRLTHWDVIAPRAAPGVGFWRYTTAPRRGRDGHWTFTVSVEFPAADLEYVTRRLATHNAG